MKRPKAQKETINRLVKTCLIYAQDADTVTEFHDNQVIILNKVDNFMATNWDGGRHWMAPFIPTIRLGLLPLLDITFLHVATFYNLTGYVKAKAPKETPQRYNPTAKSLLRFHTFENDYSEYGPRARSPQMISLLVELGANIKPEPRKKGVKKRRDY